MTNDDLKNSELSTSELAAVSAGLIITHGPNPPRGDDHHGGCHGHTPPHCSPPPRYYPGGGPDAAGLRYFH